MPSDDKYKMDALLRGLYAAEYARRDNTPCQIEEVGTLSFQARRLPPLLSSSSPFLRVPVAAPMLTWGHT